MISTPAASVVRDALARDTFAICQTLTVALQDSPTGLWLDPYPVSRQSTMMRYVGALVTQVIDAGIVRLVEDSGEVVAAALWSLDPQVAEAPVPAGGVVDGPAGDQVRERLVEVHEATRNHRLWHLPHHELLLLGVRPDRQGQWPGPTPVDRPPHVATRNRRDDICSHPGPTWHASAEAPGLRRDRPTPPPAGRDTGVVDVPSSRRRDRALKAPYLLGCRTLRRAGQGSRPAG